MHQYLNDLVEGEKIKVIKEFKDLIISPFLLEANGLLKSMITFRMMAATPFTLKKA